MSTIIKFPIALSKNTGTLVNVKEVKNGLECNCFCPKCLEPLVAVNQEIKQKAHFRHKSQTKCEFNNNFESYIHWLAKEIFKNITKISLPKILASDLRSAYRIKLQKDLSEFFSKHSLPNFIKLHFDEIGNYHISSSQNMLLQESTSINISNFTTEKVLKNNSENIRVDIVVVLDNTELFIEPFFTNPIDNDKLKKLQSFNASTISIDLLKFVDKHNYEFTKEEFENFLSFDLDSKKWIHVRDSKASSLIHNLSTRIWPTRVDKLMEIIRDNNILDKRISENQSKISILERENQRLTLELKSININEIFGI